MNNKNFVITGFDSILYVNDKKGQTVRFENRYASCFIVTKSGKISFTSDKNTVFSQKGCPVFIPEGLSYTNHCLEDAESYVFNFHTAQDCHEMCELSEVGIHAVSLFYEEIQKAMLRSDESADMAIFKELYSLAELLFSANKEMSDSEKLVSDAISVMAESFGNSTLTVKSVAEKCFVSEIYLRKLFAKYRGTTPFKELTDIRMNRARVLLLEKRPVKEIALSVGYSDIYQFSRAYKKHFGYPPSHS